MNTISDAGARPQIPMVALSIQDYEVLTAPREAFVAFLLGPGAGGGASAGEGLRSSGT
ncbi:hypothetical protein GM708_10690 [Vibrio cholerae]|jgi:hypothetical protein|nr:hypothetical protein [Vibrio cholerae]